MAKTLQFRDPIDHAGFVALSNLVMLDPNTSDGAKVTYSLLLYYARQEGSCFPGQTRLAQARGGVTDRTIRNHLEELEKRKLITVEQRGLNETNIYYIEPLSNVYTGDEASRILDSTANPDRKKISDPTGKRFPVSAEKDFRSGPEKDCRQSTSSTSTNSLEVDTGTRASRTTPREGPSSGRLPFDDPAETPKNPAAGGSSTEPPADRAIDCIPAALSTDPTDGSWPADARQLLEERREFHQLSSKMDECHAQLEAIAEVRFGKPCSHRPPLSKQAAAAKREPSIERCVDLVFNDFWTQAEEKWADAGRPATREGDYTTKIKKLLRQYGIREEGSETIDPSRVLAMCRLIVWDWEAIKDEWRSAWKCGKVPTLADVVRMKDELAACIRSGVTNQQHRYSYYHGKFVKGTPLEDKRSLDEVMSAGDDRPSAAEARDEGGAAPESGIHEAGTW